MGRFPLGKPPENSPLRKGPLRGLSSLANCGPRGGTQGAEPDSGVQRVWGPLGASEFDPSFQQFGGSESPSQGPLKVAPERLPEAPERLFRNLGEVCSFSTERGNKVRHSEAPKRVPFSRMPPERVPTLGLLPSGHR